jgi:hypothetical protein
MTGIGYAEASEHLAGRLSLDEVRARMVLRTRQFARRQVGAFRRFKGALFVDVGGEKPTDDPEDAWFHKLPTVGPEDAGMGRGGRLAPGNDPKIAIRKMMEVLNAA